MEHTLTAAELDAKMRALERSSERLPASPIIARLDGRGFSRLTTEVLSVEKPFSDQFREFMSQTVEHLMVNAGFSPVVAYTQSDEISLVLGAGDSAFSRKPVKWLSLLAGEASAAFSIAAGTPAAFDCRLIPIPSEDHLNYFRWRRSDGKRNALNASAYWLLRGLDLGPEQASKELSGKTYSELVDFLRAKGIEFESLPQWQLYGTLFKWGSRKVDGYDPIEGVSVTVSRRVVETTSDPVEMDRITQDLPAV